MRRLGSVQQKVACVFLTEVKEEESRKRENQHFQVVASEMVNPAALEADVDGALATEKLDGTCCYVTVYKGRPYLWARLDRKPTKQAEKRFRKYQHSHKSGKGFTWNVEEDFKTVPEAWIPAHRVQHHNGHPVPDEHGHIPDKEVMQEGETHHCKLETHVWGDLKAEHMYEGWVPVEADNKQYCWHSSVVDYDIGVALVLRSETNNEDLLEMATVPLANLQEQTLELIGTNVNGNPYGLGCKKRPVHCLVPHGSFRIQNPPPVDFQQLCSWFQESPEGQVEGVVWHCDDGTLMKVHRHHLGLRWPDGDTFLASRAVVIRVDGTEDEYDNSKDLFTCLSRLNGHHFSRLQDIHYDL